METRTVYCSACDRQVRVVERHPPDADAGTDPTAFVCLDCGDRCTGALCAITELPPAQMRVRLSRLDPPPEREVP